MAEEAYVQQFDPNLSGYFITEEEKIVEVKGEEEALAACREARFGTRQVYWSRRGAEDALHIHLGGEVDPVTGSPVRRR